MRTMMLTCLACALLPATLTAQARERGRMGERMIPHVLASTLLEHRERLELTEEQATRLDQIRESLRDRNRELLAEVEALRGDNRPGDLTQAQRDEISEKIRVLRANVAEANEQARDLLTADQRTTVDSMRRRVRQDAMMSGVRARMREGRLHGAHARDRMRAAERWHAREFRAHRPRSEWRLHRQQLRRPWI